MRLSILLVFGICCQICFGQNIKQIRTIDSNLTLSQMDSLRFNFGYKKTIPAGFESPILLALSYFPELDSTKIIFKKTKIKTTLNARPTIISLLFRKRTKRTYIIRINTHRKDSIVRLDKAPFDAKIGILGHEFCHITDYMGRNIFGILKRLLAYTNDKSKESYEKEIDTKTIQRGLGWQLYAWAYYEIRKSDATRAYITFKMKIYLEPGEILELINKSKE